MPSWSLSKPSCSTSWSMAVYLSSSPSCLATCRLAVVLSIFGWFDTSHYSCWVQVSKARLVLRSRRTGFEDSRYLLKYWFVKAIPSCGGAHLHDMFKSCTLRRYQDFRLGCIFFLFLLSLVLSINSPNATTLHSRCIWEGVLEYNSQG